MIEVPLPPDFEAWRREARRLLALGAPPSDVFWAGGGAAGVEGQRTLFGGDGAPRRVEPARESGTDDAVGNVPSAFLDLARTASFHRESDRYHLLYRLVFRLTHGEPYLLDVMSDPDTARLRRMVQAVRRDVHEAHAFVRFKPLVLGAPGDGTSESAGEYFVAWHRPDHPILKLAAPFFARRFASLRFSVLTPDESAHWDGAQLTFGEGVPKHLAPEAGEDAPEELFRTYYRSIYNPARVNLKAMRAEMPARHWATMPETSLMSELVRESHGRVAAMTARPESASEVFVPATRSLAVLREAARSCRACALCERATQTVFGEGPGAESSAPNAPRLMLVGEQPGDEEDLAGRPFVGPAGKVLDAGLRAAGIDRAQAFVTNAVKHFKWEPRGKRRLHSRPLPEEVSACRGWLDAELAAVRPHVIVCLGATAAQSFIGRRFRVGRSRGEWFETPWAPHFMATYHPSALLRMAEPSRSRAEEQFAADLASAASVLRSLSLAADG